MEVDSTEKEAAAAKAATAASKAAASLSAAIDGIVAAALPEVEVYLSTLALTTLLRHKAHADALSVAPGLLERAVSFNRRYGVSVERG